MKLNLSCGHNHKEGYANFDKEPACTPDLLVVVEDFPCVFNDDCAIVVILSYVFKHIRQRQSGPADRLAWR